MPNGLVPVALVKADGLKIMDTWFDFCSVKTRSGTPTPLTVVATIAPGPPPGTAGRAMRGLKRPAPTPRNKLTLSDPEPVTAISPWPLAKKSAMVTPAGVLASPVASGEFGGCADVASP